MGGGFRWKIYSDRMAFSWQGVSGVLRPELEAQEEEVPKTELKRYNGNQSYYVIWWEGKTVQ
jgi:hypothetical protein